jgi:ribosomal protein S18 acetylase RimI-like enzyme
VEAGVAQVEKAAEAALLRRQQQQRQQMRQTRTQLSEDEQSQSPGFVGFRPRPRPFDRSRSDDDDSSGVDRRWKERPTVTVRPGPGVTITRTSDNVVVAASAEDDTESPQASDQDLQPEASAADGQSSADEEEGGDSESEAAATRAAAAAALLRRRAMKDGNGPAKSNTKVGRTQTSVGAIRAGGARRAGGTVAGKLLGTVRTAAAAAAAARQKNGQQQPKDDGSANSTDGKGAKMSLAANANTKSLIESTVSDLMKREEDRRRASQPSSFGLFGEPLNPSYSSYPQSQQQPQPQPNLDEQYAQERAFHNYISYWQPPQSGSILLHPQINNSDDENSTAGANAATVSTPDAEYFAEVRDQIAVRVATPWDDIDIANLRLSVFSEMAPELRAKFCQKSCEVLDHRRNKGATCLVAAIDSNKRDSIVARNVYQDGADYGDLIKPRESTSSQWFMGSVEVSVHEFYGTELGKRRPAGTVLYITEVAVLPEARRTGAATRLMLGVDELASLKGIESLYLHVDVNNLAAITLYEKAGYRIIGKYDSHPMFEEFTMRLNLHDGATKGRKHYLMEKHLNDSPSWIDVGEEADARFVAEMNAAIAEREERAEDRGSLGFEVGTTI